MDTSKISINEDWGNNYCPHCHQYHTGICPYVKAIEYYPDGTVKRIEYHNNTQGNPICFVQY
jgi:hypothetical protein